MSPSILVKGIAFQVPRPCDLNGGDSPSRIAPRTPQRLRLLGTFESVNFTAASKVHFANGQHKTRRAKTQDETQKCFQSGNKLNPCNPPSICRSPEDCTLLIPCHASRCLLCETQDRQIRVDFQAACAVAGDKPKRRIFSGGNNHAQWFELSSRNFRKQRYGRGKHILHVQLMQRAGNDEFFSVQPG